MNLIRAANLRGVETLVSELGADPVALLARYNLDPSRLRDPDAYLPYRNVARLIEQCAVELGCPDFGLRLSRWQGLDMLGPVAVIARNAEDVLSAFQAIGRYLHVHGPALKLALRGRNSAGDYCFTYRIDEPGVPYLAQSYELSMANASRILQFLAGAAAVPTRVAFVHHPLSPVATYQRFFGCPVAFDQVHCIFELPAEIARRRLSASDPETRRVMQDYLSQRQSPGGGLNERVRELILGLLPTGHCDLESVAEQLALHPRTLQRRLREEGLSYDALVDSVRRDRATTYLATTALRLSQIAGMLGYSEQSAFTRACRRWFGQPPGIQRRRTASSASR
ncbi:AraC family transcriptional regulator [Algiphilus sp.]|uniref:AraC family transcriptional regulator n=1 Tax=Algiphilus sp. TaxID=1872431 RepID=UPI0025C54124|nr:AraC family transcriptional regulator [Algiphilus sp.]MCK5771766.1 AraC family transcriptional regulator [Algiphilus sp.]